ADSPLAGLDEVHEVLHLAERCKLLAYPLDGLADVELRAEYEPVGALELPDGLVREAAALQAHAVQPVELYGVPHGLQVGRHVLGHARAAAHERMPADAHELVR